MVDLSSYQLVKSGRGGQKTDKEAIVIAPKYIAFSAALRKKVKDKYVGFYIDSTKNELVVHFSSVRQAGYYKASATQFVSKTLLDSVHRIGLGWNVVETFERLNYLDEDTIKICRRGDVL